MKSKLVFFLGMTGLIFLGFANICSAATIFTDNFNGYNPGFLNGQGGWSASQSYAITTNPVKEGTGAVSGFSFNADAPAVKSGALVNDGQITVYVRRGDTNQPGIFSFRLREADAVKIEVRGNYGSSGKFQYVDGSTGSYVDFGTSFNFDTWYAVQIQWRSSDHAARYNIDGKSWTNWAPSVAPWTSGLDTVELETTNSISWDTIGENLLSSEMKTPVLIVPGLMGTEMVDSHGFLWPNLDRMFFDSSDSFMDTLSLDQYLNPSNSSVLATDVVRNSLLLGAKVSHYTDDLLDEFTSQGYKENETLFTFPYDWRYGASGKYADGKTNSDLLAQKIQDILAKTGSDKVDVVAHSLGGLIVKKYVVDHPTNHHIGKAVFVGVPNTGALKALKVLLQGDNFDISFAGFGLSTDEIKKISENMPAPYDLLPSQQYYNAKGSFVKVVENGALATTQRDLNYQDFGSFITNDHQLNSLAFTNAQNLHTASFDNIDLRTAGIDLYAIDGCKTGTLNSIVENRQSSVLGDTITGYQMVKFKDGDDTVPIESSGNLPIDDSHRFYLMQAKHSNMLTQDGSRQEIVNLLAGSNLNINSKFITQDVSRCGINGKVISKHSPINILAVDQNGNHSGVMSDGSVVNEIPGADYETFGDQGYLYLPTDDAQTYTVGIQGTGSGTYTIDSQNISDGQVTGTEVFSNLPVTTALSGQINMGDSQTTLTIKETPQSAPVTILPSATLDASQSQDVVPPVTTITIDGKKDKAGNYKSEADVLIKASDADSGVLSISYDIDGTHFKKINGDWVNFEVEKKGDHVVQFFATDKAGNNSAIQSLHLAIAKSDDRGKDDKDKKNDKSKKE